MLFPVSAPSLFTALEQRIPAPQWQIILRAADLAQQQGWGLYVVGGIVRDLIQDLAQAPPPHFAQPSLDLASPQREGQSSSHCDPVDWGNADIDLVVDGSALHPGQPMPKAGWGVALAQLIQADLAPDATTGANDSRPETRWPRLEIHTAFKTSTLRWPKPGGAASADVDPALIGFWLDIATARRETYAHPAANPTVEATSIHQDLKRRDFSCNALAIALTPSPGQLLDLFQGQQDLAHQQLRTLHPQSFVDDPTRAFRGARFAARFGFDLAPESQQELAGAVAQLAQLRQQYPNAPALQIRLQAELRYLLSHPTWPQALTCLQRWGAMAILHPQLRWTPQLQRRLHFAARSHPYLALVIPRWPALWLVMLEVLLADLGPSAESVAVQLRLGPDSVARLKGVGDLIAGGGLISGDVLIDEQTRPQRPSVIVQRLAGCDRTLVGLAVLLAERPLRQTLWRYLRDWSQVQSPLNGKALKRLGYPSGPLLRDILAALTAALLDGEMTECRPEAWLAQHFPLT
jgi:tRNA nucleotidyltransferase (CCA-adding enzyme)